MPNVYPCVAGKPYVPEKMMIGTLTSSILQSVHTSMSPIFSYKLCSVATPGHSKSFPLENYGRIVALTLTCKDFPYSVIDFLHYSSTTELLLSLILIKGSYPSSKAHYYAGDRH